MALKRKISKEVYDALPDAIKAEYKEQGGEYVLDVDDSSELQRAKDRETQLRKDAEKRAADLQKQLDDASDIDAKRRGDIETLEKSWQDKLTKRETELTGQISKLSDFAKKSLIDGTAQAIAAKISTVPALMKKVIAERLTVDFEGDAPTLKVLDAAGKISALTIEDLTKEFVDNKEYSSIIIGSKASGSSGTDKTRLPGSTGQGDKPTSLAAMPARDLAEAIKARKEQAA